MTIQRSDCCKATIDLDKTKERPECYTCSKCGRIIGSPLPQPTMNQIPNIEEEKEEIIEPDKVFDCFDEGCEECTVCKYLNFREWAEGCAPAGSSIERNQLVEDYLKRKHQQLQKAREEERERIEAIFKEHVPPHAMDLEDSVWLKRLLNKAFGHENIH